jgi:hypothetical protein
MHKLTEDFVCLSGLEQRYDLLDKVELKALVVYSLPIL